MKNALLALSCFISLSLFSQFDGTLINIDIQNAPTGIVDVSIDFTTSGEDVNYVVPISPEIIPTYLFPVEEWNTCLVSIEDCNGDSLFVFLESLNQPGFTYYAGFYYCESDSTFGCTDPNALNYNSLANVDDGSCIYSGPENDLCSGAIPLEEGTTLIDNTYATQNEGIWGECWNFGSGEGEQTSLWFTFTTPSVPSQIHIEAISDGSFTFTDTQFGLFEECGGEMIYCDGNSGEELLSAFDFSCGELDTNATYILMVDGWSGDAGTCFLSYSVTSPCDFPAYGCTDPLATNYNPEATEDDGSCAYSCTPTTLVFDAFDTQNDSSLVYWSITLNDSLVVEEGYVYGWGDQVDLCLQEGCFYLDVFNINSGWSGTCSLFAENGVQIFGIIENSSEWISEPFGINSPGCGNSEILGCTDPNAINYNPEATINDGSCAYFECDGNELDIILNTQNWGYEISWAILNENGQAVAQSEGYESYATSIESVCLGDGCYTFEMYDSYGDGWNGGTFELRLDGMIIASGTLSDGEFGEIAFSVNADCETEISGCTDPNASNYNPEATIDDGSCEYDDFECGISFEVVADSSGENTFYIIPSSNIVNASSVLWDFGDGGTSTEFYPTYVYETDGPFTLCLFVTFEDDNGNFCQISYCEVLDGEIFGENGVLSEGFMINVIPQGTLNDESARTEEIISVYPNPTSDLATISFIAESSNRITLSLIDLQGKVLEQRVIAGSVGTQNVDIVLSEFPAGLYLIGISSEQTTSYAKVVRR
ncbi:MAG: T9SS type A sorting domain-containing protein [Flavobacteriales bacterium]|nr:T9SS type A sorting domain-containing protein [Flavobacteriales bacterium]